MNYSLGLGVRNAKSRRSAARFNIAQHDELSIAQAEDVSAPVHSFFEVQMQLRSVPVRPSLQGVGIAIAVEETVAEFIAAGRLVPLLERWSAPFPGYFLCYPQQRQMAPALRAFIDAVRGGAIAPSAPDAQSGAREPVAVARS